MKNYTVIGLLGFVCLSAFAGRTEIAPAGNKVTKAGVISIYSEWVKDKGKKYDLNLTLSNDHDKDIIVLLNDFRCFRGTVSGEIKSDDTIHLLPGKKKGLTVTCNLGSKTKGEYRIVVTKVYENPASDEKTLGKVIGTEIEWKVAIAD
jgi:hypothetical protein